jgi:acetylornithine deacetylase/succinyl-diaminopimelate desuccinylase-like protein
VASPSVSAIDPLPLAQALIRFDTSNPPGREREALVHLAGALRDAGVDSEFLAADQERPNLLVRVPGEGIAPPLLLHAHVDVVPADAEQWRHDPFGGASVGGDLWGRGSLDMKGPAAMLVAAVTRLLAGGERPAGDLILLVMSDEETGSAFGSRFICEEHPGVLDGVRYAIGEGGGFTSWLGGRCFYPVAVAEKKRCLIRAVCRGPAGHGSSIVRDSAMGRLGALLSAITAHRLPHRVTPAADAMIRALADRLGRDELLDLLDPRAAEALLSAHGSALDGLAPVVHDTVAPTVVHGGGAPNVHPSEVAVMLDARLVPGQTVAGLIAEIEAIVPGAAQYEVVREEPAPGATADLALLPLIEDVLLEADPSALVVPALIAGFTDARYFAGLGIQNYGFLPMRLPERAGMELIHAPDERIPVSELEFGAGRLYELLRRYGRGSAAL